MNALALLVGVIGVVIVLAFGFAVEKNIIMIIAIALAVFAYLVTSSFLKKENILVRILGGALAASLTFGSVWLLIVIGFSVLMLIIMLIICVLIAAAS